MKLSKRLLYISFIVLSIIFLSCNANDSAEKNKGEKNSSNIEANSSDEALSYENAENDSPLYKNEIDVRNDEFRESIERNIILEENEKVDRAEWLEDEICYWVSVVKLDGSCEREYIFVNEGTVKCFTFSTDEICGENLTGMEGRLLELYPVKISYEDITFDGKKDIIAFLGKEGDAEAIGLFIYSDGDYVYSDSFVYNRIRDYSVDYAQNRIFDQNDSEYIYKGNGKFEPIVREKIEDSEFRKYVNDKVEVRKDEELGESRWIVDGVIYRVTINQTVEPAEYAHLRDYFFINGEKTSWFEVKYSRNGNPITEDRILGSNCDFFAEYRDITFDGNKDIVIYLGAWGFASKNCVYVNKNGEFKYCKKFEEVSNYILNYEENCIEGWSEDGLYNIGFRAEYKDDDFIVECTLTELD